MSATDRISPDQDDSVPSEPLGIKEPLQSPTALGQSRFLMPLGLRSLSVLQPIAVHPQVDDFDFSSIQAVEPTYFQEPSLPNLQLSSLPEPTNGQSAIFEIPARGHLETSEEGRSSQINSLPQKPSTSQNHPGTSRSQPVQGVVQFFKSVFGRKDSPVPEQTSTPEFLSVADSPQPLSEASPLVQLQGDKAATSSKPPQAILSSELASSSFFDHSNATTQQPLGSNLETQQQTELPEDAATQTVTQQLSVSNLEIQQRGKHEGINASKDANFPFVSSQAPLQRNIVSLSVNSADSVSADDLGAIAPNQFDGETQDLKPRKIGSEEFLPPISSTIQLQQENKLEQEISLPFSQDKPLSGNLINFSEVTTVKTELEESLTKKEVSASKTEPVERSQIQRQTTEQSTDSFKPISSTEISTGIEQITQSASTNQQVIQPQDHSQTNQNLSVIQTRNDGITSQNQPKVQRNDDVVSNHHTLSATDSTFPLLNDVEISTLQTKQLQTKQDNSFEQVSYSLETGRAEQSESIQSSSLSSPKTRELEDQTAIQQPVEAPTENAIERAIAFIPEGFIPGIEQQEAPQPLLQLREHPSTEINEPLFKSVASAESITPDLQPQSQQISDWTEITASHQLISSAETLPVSRSNRYKESEILQKQSEADTPLNPDSLYDASATSHQDASSTSLDPSLTDDITSTHDDASTPSSKKIPICEDISLADHSPSSTANYDTPSAPQERLANSLSSDVLQLREEKAEILDLPFQEFSQTLLPKDLSTSSKSSSQDWNAVGVAPLSLPKIQRQAEEALTDTIGAAEEVLLLEEAGSLEESQLGSKNAAVQNQSDVRGESDVKGDRNYQSFISTDQNSVEPIEPDISVNSVSLQELNVQRHPTTENTQTTIQQNSAPIRLESHPVTLSNSHDEVETQIDTVSSEFIEPETRSPQPPTPRPPSNESPQPQNDSILEDLSSLEIQRQLENSVSINHVVSKDLSDIEAENPLENKNLSTSVNDSDAFIAPLTLNSFQSEDHSEPRTLSATVNDSDALIEPSTPESLQMKSAQADELAVASSLQNVSVADSFELDLESSTAFNHPGSEQHLLANTFEPSSQFTSSSLSVQAASAPANDSEVDFTLAGKNILESIEFVPNPVAQSSVTQSLSETAIAPSTSESLLNRASQSNDSERPELTSPLTDSASNSSNIQREIEPSKPAIQSSTPPDNGVLQADHLEPTSQSVTEQNDNSLQSSSGASQQHPHNLPQSPLNIGNVTFPIESTPTESTEEKILSPVQSSSPTLENLSENLPHPIVQPKHHSDDESNSLETITSSESRHSDSNIESFVEHTSNALNQSVSEVPIQATSISPGGTHIGSYEAQENIPVETNNLVYARSDADPIAQDQLEASQSSIPSEPTFGERAIASHPIAKPDRLTVTGEPDNTAIQQRPIENIDRSPELTEPEISSPVLPSTPVKESLPSSAGEQQSERLDSNNYSFLENSPGIQQSERLETDSHAFLASSLDIQPESESRFSVEGLSLESNDLSARSLSEAIAPSSSESSTTFPVTESSSEAIALSFSDTESFSEAIAPSSSEPSITLPVTESSSKAIAPSSNEPSIALSVTESSSEAIAPSFSDIELSSATIVSSSSEPSIALSTTESSSEAIVDTWDASSSYDSTPNGRNAETAATGNQLPVESEIFQVFSNPLSSDIQRFVNDSSEHSSSSAPLNSSDQAEIATPSSSELPADLPQLPRFLQDLTVLKPLVQRSSLTVTPKNTTPESADAGALNVLFENSSGAIAQSFSEPTIALPSTEPSFQAIGNDGNTASYNSTPNGRRDAQLAAAQNHPPIESEISSVFPSSLSSDIQQFTEDSTESLSPSVQLDRADQSKTVTPSSSTLPANLPQLPRFLQNLTVLKPLVQRSSLNAFPVTDHADLLDNLPLRSSSEAIAQPLAESAIPSIESSSQAIGNDGNTASYDSTPNGRRDAQLAAAQNHLPVESESPQFLSSSLSFDIQRFVDDSSSFSAQPSSSDQAEAVSFSSSQRSADLPQLPKFLKDLTVLKPLIQRSFHEPSEELPDPLPNELVSHSTARSLPNSSPSFSLPHHENHKVAVQPQQSPIQSIPSSAPTTSATTVPAHPGTAPGTWSSLAELVNPKPSQPQQSSTNHYSPLAPSVLQAKIATPTLQRAIDTNAPIEVPNAPTTTLCSSDFQQEAHLDTLLETLAQEIYGLLRQKMEIERERQGRSLGRMPW